MDDKEFRRMMMLQMAETRDEAIKILRTDPNLTEEIIQRMAQLWPKAESEKDALVQGEAKKDNILTQGEISDVLSGRVSVAEILGLSEEEVEANMARDEETT